MNTLQKIKTSLQETLPAVFGNVNDPIPAIIHKSRNAFKVLTLILTSFCSIAVAQPAMVRLQMSGPNNALDETIVYFQPGATDGFDSEYDAYKLSGPNPHPEISQLYSSTKLLINGIEPVTNQFSMPILTTTPFSGSFTLFATDFADMPSDITIKLTDTYTGIITDILTSNYTFTLDDTTQSPRFLLEVMYMSVTVPASLQISQPTCSNTGGKCIAQGNGNGPWNYSWKDINGTIVKTTLNSIQSDTLDQISGGSYSVDVERVGGANFNSTVFNIDTLLLPTASFSAPDTIVINSGNDFTAVNTSTNAQSYSWDYGDINSVSTDINGTYTYSAPGNYTVTLTGYNNLGCSDTYIKTISVIDAPTSVGLSHSEIENIKWCTLGKNQFLIKNPENEVLELQIFNLKGQKVINEIGNLDNMYFDFNTLAGGTYIITLKSKKTFKKMQCIIE